MKRREFITLAGGMAVWPLTARAQQNKRTRRVAILTPAAEDPEHGRWFAAFVQELHDLGWIDGETIQIDTHWATADVGRINRAAMEVIDRKPDVIVASGPLSVAALRPMTSTIPIVFTNVADPVGTGLVASLARPGGNITGFTLGEFAMSGKLLNVLKQVAPQVRAGWPLTTLSAGGLIVEFCLPMIQYPTNSFRPVAAGARPAYRG